MATSSCHEMVRSIIPPLSFSKHKGQDGRIAVVGGCKEYTGAPYYAAISSLKVGCDLSHVICAKEAAPVIKSYSPELIVHPILDDEAASSSIRPWLERMHCVVVGPGLGRDAELLKSAKNVIEMARELDIPLVIDADGLCCVEASPEIVRRYEKCILTPNIVEFKRLAKSLNVAHDVTVEDSKQSTVRSVSRALGQATVVLKGTQDVISNGTQVLVCAEPGGPRRCGGQGDLLCGSMGTFAHWARLALRAPQPHALMTSLGPWMCAAWAACALTRGCNQGALRQHGRGMTTPDMITAISATMRRWDDPVTLSPSQ